MSTISPQQILERLYDMAASAQDTPKVKDDKLLQRIGYVVGCLSNRACVRLLMSCMLGKIDCPHVDPREPYTKIGGNSSFSGRMYDEKFITAFINRHNLPCNITTAFLTPALRNIDRPLTADVVLVGRPGRIYCDTIEILEAVAYGQESAENVLADTIRLLCVARDKRKKRMQSLVESMDDSSDRIPLSSEEIITLISQHLACRNTSRLPVLLIAAIYSVAKNKIGETVGELFHHNAADRQTGALGDVQVCLVNDTRVVTCYEIKQRQVSTEDIDLAVTKIASHTPKVDNYIFVSTETIDAMVVEHARLTYRQLEGIEIAVMDCLGFVRHFLHLFHRVRGEFLDAYQKLILAEPDSAVSQPLKEAFLSLRQAAESDE